MANTTYDAAATIAFLRAAPSPGGQHEQDAFFAELAAAGYVAGTNLTLVAASPDEAHPDPGEAAALAAQWEAQGHDLILALSSAGATVAADAAPATDILFISNDPTATGLVDDERRPEGNLTGVTFRVPADRLLDLTRRLLPGTDLVGVLDSVNDPASGPSRQAAVDAVDALGLDAHVESFDGPQAAQGAVDRLVTAGVDVILLTNSPSTVRALPEIESAIAPTGLPVVAATSVATTAILVLEPDTTELYRQLGRQAARLLDGAPTSAVPVEDPARFRLVVNTGVAAELGVTVPRAIVDEADRVIE